jgi:hypothetical protein
MRRSLLLVSLVLATLAVPVAVAATGGSFKGKTAQNRTLSFTVKGGKVTKFSAGINMMCVQSGIELNAVIPPKALRVKHGRFSYEGRDATDGTNIEITGRLKGKRASGTVRMTDSRYNAASQTFDSCVGSARWTAKAK